MSEKIIRIKSGNEEITMNVTEESYEEWKENDMRTEFFAESMEELAEKRMLLGVLQDTMDSLLPEERELAMKVFGEEMSVCEYAESFSHPIPPWCRSLPLFWRDSKRKIKKPENRL